VQLRDVLLMSFHDDDGLADAGAGPKRAGLFPAFQKMDQIKSMTLMPVVQKLAADVGLIREAGGAARWGSAR